MLSGGDITCLLYLTLPLPYLPILLMFDITETLKILTLRGLT